jgi:hypothetical protein
LDGLEEQNWGVLDEGKEIGDFGWDSGQRRGGCLLSRDFPLGDHGQSVKG